MYIIFVLLADKNERNHCFFIQNSVFENPDLTKIVPNFMSKYRKYRSFFGKKYKINRSI